MHAPPVRPPLPHPREPPTTPANPCPKVTDPFCRLPLPTFFHSLEAAHLEDLLRLSVRPQPRNTVSRIFKGRTRPEDRHQNASDSHRDVLRGPTPFHTVTASCRTRERAPLPRPTSPSPPRVAALPVCGAGISTGFPFGACHQQQHVGTPRPPLGPPPQRPTAVPVEPFPTSVFKGPFESLLLPPRSALQTDPARSTAGLALGPHALLLATLGVAAGPRSSA